MTETSQPYADLAIYDETFGVTFTFGKQVGEIDGTPVYETFADGQPWGTNFAAPLIEAMRRQMRTR